MFLPPTHSKTNRRERRAFVLVSVLLLVALATVLVVVAAMMAQVERRAAANAVKIEQARANALFALDAALDQLQSSAGPDQRITARADILDSNPSTADINGVNQPYWTGVWKTGNASLDIVSSGTPQRQISFNATNSSPTPAQKAASATWLVSGTNAVNPLTYTPTVASGANSTGNATDVVIARGLGANSQNVTVPIVPMLQGNRTVGAYAYWVSDEGVKARINLASPTLESSSQSLNQLHHLTSQSAVANKGILGNSTADIRSETNALSRVLSLQALGNVPPLQPGDFQGTSAARFSPDITLQSIGVLADVRRGGLKKDLTAAFESTTANSTAYAALTSNYGNGINAVYRATTNGMPPFTGSSGAAQPDGPLWLPLHAFYNLYKASVTTPVAVTPNFPRPLTPSGIGDPANLPYSASAFVHSADVSGSKITSGGLYPALLAFRVHVAVDSYNAGSAGTPNYRLRLRYFPQAVLYNPYSVTLSAPLYALQKNFNAFANTQLNIRVNGSVTWNGTIRVNQVGSNGTSGRLNLQTRAGDSDQMRPGEIRVFSLVNDEGRANLAQALTFNGTLRSTATSSADFSQYADIPGFPGTANAADTVTITVTSPNPNWNAGDNFVDRTLMWPNSAGTVRYQNIIGPGVYLGPMVTGNFTNIRIDALANGGAPPLGTANARSVAGVSWRAKGINNLAATPSFYLEDRAPPILHGNSADLFTADDSSYWSEIYVQELGLPYSASDAVTPISTGSGPMQSIWGDASAGLLAVPLPGGIPTRYVLRDVPSQPMVSLGQFMHNPASYSFNAVGPWNFRLGSMYVGGSYASPVVPTDQTVGDATKIAGASQKIANDDSFLANEALFDRFFFSTVPPSGSPPTGTAWPDAWTQFAARNPGPRVADQTAPLLNSRMTPFFREGAGPLLSDLRDFDRAAANLMVAGAFNVNSTSVEAWKAFLGSLSGNALAIFNATGGSVVNLSSFGRGVDKNPIPRFWSASATATPNAPWDGLRVLDDTQLTELATRIVEQVKLRGPFLSMADFLNRRLGTAGPLTTSGALQSAIDSTSPDINASGSDSPKSRGVPVAYTSLPAPNETTFSPIAANLKDFQGQTLNTAVGMPGYLMQQDLVQAFAPSMAVRSDTFILRVFGEVRNPVSGIVEARAYGEAVVQRIPDLIDDSQPPETARTVMNSTNAALGRSFIVVSFRWLAREEI